MDPATRLAPLQYPPVARIPVVDTYHDNIPITDPYRWLEDPDSPETVQFVAAQNRLTESFLSACETRDPLAKRLTEIYNYERFSCPFKRGKQYFFFKNDGLQNQSVLYKQKSLDSPESVLLDPNLLAADGTAALGAYAFSEDAQFLAYGVARAGSDWQSIYTMRVENNEVLEGEVLEWIKFSSISWTHDGKGFFYSRYPKPSTIEGDDTDFKRGTQTEKLENHSVYYHRVGTPVSEDFCVFSSPENPRWMVSAEVSHDGEYVLFSINDSCDPVNRLFYAKLHAQSMDPAQKLEIVKLIDNFEAEYNYVTNEGTQFYFKTNRNAPRYKVISIDFSNPVESAWREVIAHHRHDVLSFVQVVNQNQLILCYMKDVKEILQLRDLNGRLIVDEFPLPDLGSITGLTGRKQDNVFFYQFQSFLYPGTIYMIELRGSNHEMDNSNSGDSKQMEPHTHHTCKIFRETLIAGFSAGDYETKQVKYKSKDGTEIPMFIVHDRNMQLDGNNPTLLYGYGGFNISLTPSFNVSRIVWMQNMGGIYCVANLRGGGEYGEEWHKAGQIHNKQNVFDDFIAAAEYLIDSKYTRPERLAIHGGSNGGLLVAACTNQRPELFGCAVAAVGVLDMLRFHKFTIGYAWTSDYGCSDNKEQFDTLIKYSPLHNINKDKAYPAVLLTTADHDDRVVCLHSYKYIAELQATHPNNPRPLLIRIEVKAGHGAGIPLTKRIAETADVYAFIAKTTGIQAKF